MNQAEITGRELSITGHPEDSPRKRFELLDSYQELRALAPLAKLSEKGEYQQFWEDKKAEIARNLKERFVSSEKPDIEVVIPVHKNGRDLPFLLAGLSTQVMENLGNVWLTLVMHNNAGDETLQQPRDESWNQVEYLQNQGVQLRVLEFTDTLLTGPYVSWQFCLCKSEAPITAVLDADSIPPPSWLKKLVAPLQNSNNEENPVKCTGSLRVFFGSPEKIIHGLSRAQFLFIAIKIALAPPGPNLVVGKRFTGGQAAYRTDAAKQIIRGWGGMPQGDHTFAEELIEQYGKDSFLYCDAPVLDRADPFRNTQELPLKLLKAARIFIPLKWHKYLVKEEDADLTELATLSRYIPWARPLIEAFLIEGKLTAQKFEEALEETAEEQGFKRNKHVRRYFETPDFKDCRDASSMLKELRQFAREAVMPTFTNYLSSTRSLDSPELVSSDASSA